MITPPTRKGGGAGSQATPRRPPVGPRPVPTAAAAESSRDSATRPAPATRRSAWVFQVPRPPSLNRMIGAGRFSLARQKARYIESVRWCLKADPQFRACLPFEHRLFVDIVIVGLWRNKPDRGNWEKWIGDALGGFLMRDDGDRFWDYRVSFDYGKPSAILYIYELDELAPGRVARSPRRRTRISRSGRWPVGLVKIQRRKPPAGGGEG